MRRLIAAYLPLFLVGVALGVLVGVLTLLPGGPR
jgi:hypothetical protein